MSTSMELTQENLESIGEYVRRNLRSWTDESMLSAYAQRDIELRERMLRVEEGIKNQGEIIRMGFARADERFDDLNQRIAEQRETSNQRFSEQRELFLARFDQIDKRFETVRDDANKRYEEQRQEMNSRFDQNSRHNNRWMAVLTIVLGLFGAVATISTLMS